MATDPTIAQNFYNKGEGEPDSQYITPEDAKAAINQIYIDLAEETAGSSGGGATTLDSLTDVNVPSPANTNALTWNSSTSQWVATAISGGAGIDQATADGRYINVTGDNMAGNLTFSADRKLTTAASSATTAGLTVPHGVAPTAPVNGDIWTTTAGMYVRINGVTIGPLNIAGLDQTTADARYANLTGDTMTGKLNTAATIAGGAGFSLPHGTTPTSPVNGDIWTTTAGIYVRINNTTIGPLGTGSGGLTQAAADLLYVNLDGDTMTGPLYVQPPSVATHAASKGYVDNAFAYKSGLKNIITNGTFLINQRAFATSSVSGEFNYDRWMHGFVGGTVITSAQTAILGALPESAPTYLRQVVSAQSGATHYADIRQTIPSVRTFSGETTTVSFWARATTGTPKVAVGVRQHFGTGGTPSANVDTHGGQAVLSTTWTRYSVIVNVPSITGKSIGTNNDDYIFLRIYTSAGTNFNAASGTLGLQANTFEFWGIQWEQGNIMNPLERITKSEQLEHCKQFYYRDDATNRLVGAQGIATLVTQGYFSITHPIRMFRLPVLSYSGTINIYDINVGLYPATVITPDTQTFSDATIIADIATSSLIVGKSIYLSIAPPAYIAYSAEFPYAA
jgi:hypothetical protein